MMPKALTVKTTSVTHEEQKSFTRKAQKLRKVNSQAWWYISLVPAFGSQEANRSL